MRTRQIDLSVGGRLLGARIAETEPGLPGILFVHGWAGSQERDTLRAQRLARLGCICLTFDMRGHGEDSGRLRQVSREDNINDILAAWDMLAVQPGIDTGEMGVVGSSYGGYLCAYLTAHRPVRWLALRVPALYRDDKWNLPREELDRADLAVYRSRLVEPQENSALTLCNRFQGHVLLVGSQHDEIVPPPVLASYRAAFANAASLTCRTIPGADHALSSAECQRAYDLLLFRWFREMIEQAR